MNTTELEAQIWTTVQQMNRAWTTDHAPDRLEQYFAEDMVAVTPTDRLRREGRAACVTGWRDFAEAFRVTDWEEREPQIRLLAGGKSAVVTYYYDIEFMVNGSPVKQGGRDMMVLEERDGHWWVVADQFSAYPGDTTPLPDPSTTR